MSVGQPDPTVLTIISKIIYSHILIGSLLQKLLQFTSVIRRPSVACISLFMYRLGAIRTTFLRFNSDEVASFFNYGENVFILMQKVFFLAIIVFYKDFPGTTSFVFAVKFVSMVITFLSPILQLSLLFILLFCSIPILNLSIAQNIMLNHRRKSIRQITRLTSTLSLGSKLSCVFPTIAQGRDPLMFVGTCVATYGNTTLFSTIDLLFVPFVAHCEILILHNESCFIYHQLRGVKFQTGKNYSSQSNSPPFVVSFYLSCSFALTYNLFIFLSTYNLYSFCIKKES